MRLNSFEFLTVAYPSIRPVMLDNRVSAYELDEEGTYLVQLTCPLTPEDVDTTDKLLLILRVRNKVVLHVWSWAQVVSFLHFRCNYPVNEKVVVEVLPLLPRFNGFEWSELLPPLVSQVFKD